jgi:hypothetical protein
MIVALVALFVALGGPAQAKRLISGKDLKKGSVTSREIRDHSLKTRDLRKSAVRSLRRTPDDSVTEDKIRNGAVTPGKLARGAVGSPAIADRSVGSGDIAHGAVGGFEVADGSITGADIADGTLDARDIARFRGHFTVRLGLQADGSSRAIPARGCWRGDPVGLAPERSGADIRGDVILVTPSAGWPNLNPPAGLTFLARASTTPGRFTLSVCNEGSSAALPPVDVTFNYVVLDVP